MPIPSTQRTGLQSIDADLAAAREGARLIGDALNVPLIAKKAGDLRVQSEDVERSSACAVPHVFVLDLDNLAISPLPGSPLRALDGASDPPVLGRSTAIEIQHAGQVINQPALLAAVRLHCDILAIRSAPRLGSVPGLGEAGLLAQTLARTAKVAIVVPPGEGIEQRASQGAAALGLVASPPETIACSGPVKAMVAAVIRLDDAPALAVKGILRRLDALLLSAFAVRDSADRQIARRDREVAALETAHRERLTELERLRRTLSEHVHQVLQEIAALATRTSWTTASLHYVLLRDPNPRLDPRPIVSRIADDTALEKVRVEPLSVAPRARVIVRDSAFRCTIAAKMTDQMGVDVAQQLSLVLEQTRSYLDTLRTKLTSWIQSIPARWSGPWAHLGGLSLPAFYGSELDKEVKLPLRGLDAEQRFVSHGAWHHIRQGRAMAGMITSFMTFLIGAAALIYLGDPQQASQVRTVLFGYSALTLFILFFIFLVVTIVGLPGERKAKLAEVTEKLKDAAEAHLCRHFQHFEEQRVAAIKAYLASVEQWILDAVNACVDTEKEGEAARASATVSGRKEIERAKRQLEGLGNETVAKQLAEAARRIDLLRRSVELRDR
jgi:hypothetical protein